MEYTVLVTFASTAELLDPVLEATFASLSNLETTRYAVIASQTTLETADKYVTFAAITTTEDENVATFGAITGAEKITYVVFGSITTLEEDAAFKTVASKTVLEKIVRATIAALTTFTFSPAPEEDMITYLDTRESGRKGFPVARYVAIVTIPAGSTSKSVKLNNVNMMVKQIVVKRPVTTAQTTSIFLYDELGCQLFTAATLSSNAISALISSEPFIPLAGIGELNLTLTGALASDARYVVEIYGV